MTTLWVEMIRMEMDALSNDDQRFDPNKPVREHEEILARENRGEVRLLYRLSRRYVYEAKKLQLDASFAGSEMTKEGQQLGYRARILALLFWDELRSLLPDYGPGNVGIRRDWTIVRCPEEEGLIGMIRDPGL